MILVRLLRSVWETTSNRFWPLPEAVYIFLCELSKLSTEFPFITQAKTLTKTDTQSSVLYIIIFLDNQYYLKMED
jgi:hypothetical protein